MNPPGKERAPVVPPEKGTGREVVAPVSAEGIPEREVRRPEPAASAAAEATQAVPAPVKPAVAPTEVDVAAPTAEIDLEAVNEGGVGGAGRASALVRGLNASLEAGPEQDKGKE